MSFVLSVLIVGIFVHARHEEQKEVHYATLICLYVATLEEGQRTVEVGSKREHDKRRNARRMLSSHGN